MVLPFPSLIQAWVKVILLLVASISHHVGLKSPNPPPSDKKTVYRGQIFEKIVHLLALASQISTIMTLLLECLVLITLAKPSSSHSQDTLFSTICRHPSPSVPFKTPLLSPSFLLGVLTMLSSAALRIWCYRTLGTLFTFEVSIKPKHALIKSGPYRFARHPSYTACVLMLVGAAMTCLASGSYINECGIMFTPAKYPIRLWQGIAVFASLSLWRRVRAEEAGLEAAFGHSWEEYTQEVPYRFIPFIV
ncbi:hypothetical protein M422DRAFT_200226 [Sphaerobolus stellatus SS14]|nr:hypothetical protein M422DRAFT_200226 [Sphaerobolus stellatus SS14]